MHRTKPNASAALTPTADLAVMNLRSALRRRGLAVTDGELPALLIVENGARRVAVRLVGGDWLRPRSGRPGVMVTVARMGGEDALARQITRELTDMLP